MKLQYQTSASRLAISKSEHVISIDGISISYVRTGARRTAVLLIHGNSSCKEVFLHQITFLANLGHDVVAVDLPGHGASEDAVDPKEFYSFPGYGRILRSLMGALGISRYYIVGWSLGGHIGLEMWFEDEAAIALLITGTPPVRLSAAGASEGFLPSDIMDLAGKETFSEDDIRVYGSAMLGEPLEQSSWLARCITRTDGKARRLMLENSLAGVGRDQVQAVATCTKPLAIVQGKNDPFVDLSHLQRLTYNNLWLKKPVMVDGGHAPHWTCHSEFNQYLGEFIDGLS